MENINFKGIPTSLFLNGPNVEIVSDSLTGNQIGSVTNNYPIFSVGTGVTFLGDGWGTVAPYFFASTYDTTNDKIVIAYQDNDDSNKGKAIVGTVTGTGITFGTPVTFGGSTEYTKIVYDSANEKVVIAYIDNDNSFYGTAIVGTVSGDTIGFGTEVVFNSATTDDPTITYDSINEKVVIAYKDDNNSYYGTARVGEVVGTGITFGSPAVFNSASTSIPAATFDPDNGKVVIVYTDGTYEDVTRSTDYGTAIVGTVNGTDISFGDPVVFEFAGSYHTSVAYVGSSKVVISYSDDGNSFYGTSIVGTVNGTDISFGIPVVYGSAQITYPSVAYDSTNDRVVIAYKDDGNSGYGTVRVGIVNGTDITFGNPVVFYVGTHSSYNSATYDPDNDKVVIFNQGTYNNGNAVVGTTSRVTEYSTPSASTPVVFDDYLQFAAATYVGNNVGINTGKVVIAYTDVNAPSDEYPEGEPNKSSGVAIVGTVTGTGITFGTPAEFLSRMAHEIISTYDSINDRVVIAYKDNSWYGYGYGTAVVAEVTVGSGITFGTPVIFESAGIYDPTITYDSTNGKVVIAYSDYGNYNYGTAVVGTVDPSNNSISFGDPVVFESAYVGAGRTSGLEGYAISAIYDSTNDKVVIAYKDNEGPYSQYGNSSDGTAIVGTIDHSDNSIGFGTPVVFDSSECDNISATFDSTNGEVVIAYRDNGNSDYGTAIVGEVIGTGITFGDPAYFNYNNSISLSSTYNSTDEKVVIAYRDLSSASGHSSFAIEGTVVGTAITFGTPVEYAYGGSHYTSSTYDSDNNKVVIAYSDQGNRHLAAAVVYTSSALLTNLTTENYTDVVGVATFTGIATATFNQNPTAILDGGSIDFKWYYNGSRILDVSEDITSGAVISTSDFPEGTGSTITISGKNSELNGKEVYFTVGYIPSAYQSETPVTAGTARSTGYALNEPVQSTIATIVGKPEIEITNQPNSLFVPLDTAATYNIEARTIPGNGPVNYQWQLDGIDLVDGTTTTTVQELSTGKITVVRPSLPFWESELANFNEPRQGLITETIDFSEVASYDQFIPPARVIPGTWQPITLRGSSRYCQLSTDRDIIVRFHLEGAAGGSSQQWPNQGGGRGGLSVGTITLLQGETYILNIGERGEDTKSGPDTSLTNGSGGGPGGGDGGWNWNGGGGGYTGLFLSSVSQENSLLIAGGGGGSSNGSVRSIGGAGGGGAGGNGGFWGNWGQMGLGGTQNPPVMAGSRESPGGQSAGFGSKLQGAGGIGAGGGGGGGYWGGGAGRYRSNAPGLDSAGGGGSGHINESVVSDATTTLGKGSTGDGSARIDAISSPKEVTTIISGSQTNNLSITTNDPAAGVIRCRVSADIDVVESPVFSRSVSYYTSAARSIVNIEEIIGDETTANLTEVDLADGEFVFEASSNDTEPPKLYSFYSTERDIDVEVEMYGGKGDGMEVSADHLIKRGTTAQGGEGGYSRIQFTMEQNVEYVIAGLTPDIRAPFLYRKGELMAVVGGGGGGSFHHLYRADGTGGTGGGVDIAGSTSTFGMNSGSGGHKIDAGDLGSNGKFGSSYSAPELYPGDVQSGGLEGGQTIKCTKGQYWAEQGKGACDDLGSVKFRLKDGPEVTNTSSSITRGFKAGYNIMQTAGKHGVNGGAGGNGATGGSGGTGGNVGGGGGSGYQDGSVTVIDTMQGGSTGDAKVVLRVIT